MTAQLALNAKAWPFEQARLLLKRIEQAGLGDKPVVFETGYGPSGLPHIGTFGDDGASGLYCADRGQV